MEYKRFSSPREESLEIALETRTAILNGKKDVVSVLRSCLVIANRLNKRRDEKWIKSELFGYDNAEEAPKYRVVTRSHEEHGALKSIGFKISHEIQLLYVGIMKGEGLLVHLPDGSSFTITRIDVERIINHVINNCLMFLNDVIAELQYGGIVENMMEEIRRNVDEKLIKLDKRISEESSSIFASLSSPNPTEWSKVAHSCRRILKFVVDNTKVFPSRKEKYTMKDGTQVKVGDQQYLNRLCAFWDQKLSKEQRKFMMVETEYLKDYLHLVSEKIQKGEHETIEKHDADMIAVHTYLIVSEILKLL